MPKKTRLPSDNSNPEFMIIRDKFGIEACKKCIFCKKDFTKPKSERHEVALVLPYESSYPFSHYFDKHVRPYLEFHGDVFDWRWDSGTVADFENGYDVYSAKNNQKYTYRDYLEDMKNVNVKELKKFELMRKLYVGR